MFRELSNGQFQVVSSDRLTLHETISDSFWGDNPIRGAPGRRAIVMAGPPGAGKSTALPDISPEFFQGKPFALIDSDDLKSSLLNDAIATGYYESQFLPLVKMYAAGGARFFPMDFAGLVHAESMILHAQLIRDGIASRANLVIDGTMAWRRYGEDILTRLQEAGYVTQLIVDVEASRSEAEEHAYLRWREGHLAAVWLTDEKPGTEPMGGRIVPSISYDTIFEDGIAKTLTNARSLADEFDIPVMVFFPARTKKAPELVFDSAHGGTVVHITSTGRRRGRCSVCGRAIWSPTSIARGSGPECASKLP